MGLPSDKEFKTYEEMIGILKSRNIKFKDEENAIYVLKNIPYYTLINGYKDIFIASKQASDEADDFQDTDFDYLKIVHVFDKKLSAILFDNLTRIEDSLKSILSYSLSSHRGYIYSDYILENNFRPGKRLVKADGTFKNKADGTHLYSRDKLIKELESIHNSDYYKTVTYYKNEYSNVPPWILSKYLTLGKLVHLYKLSKLDVRKEVFEHFLDLDRTTSIDIANDIFMELILIVHEYRNIIAHSDRVLMHTGDSLIKPSSLFKYLHGGAYSQSMKKRNVGKNQLTGLFLAIIILYSNRNSIRNSFIEDIQKIFKDLQNNNEDVYEKVLKNNNISQYFIDNLNNFLV